MNYAPNTENRTNHRDASGDLPPVLARVPWLEPTASDQSARCKGPASSEVPALREVAPCETALDASFFQPHSVVAAADMDVADWSANGFSSTEPKFRFDPPQPMPTRNELHAPSTPAEPIGRATETIERQPSVQLAPASASPTVERMTNLRFDAPVRPVVERTVPTTKADSHAQPSTWHLTVATIDNAIRRYHRVIVLAALLTAAGLMMLVLESQHPLGEPAGESAAPATMENFAADPLPLAELMASRHQKAAEPSAKGPQPDVQPRTASVVEPEVLESIPLEPIESYRDLHSFDEPPSRTTDEVDSDEMSVSTAETEEFATDPTGYPSTNAAEIVWPASLPKSYPSSLDATPNVARLTREIQSVTEPTTK